MSLKRKALITLAAGAAGIAVFVVLWSLPYREVLPKGVEHTDDPRRPAQYASAVPDNNPPRDFAIFGQPSEITLKPTDTKPAIKTVSMQIDALRGLAGPIQLAARTRRGDGSAAPLPAGFSMKFPTRRLILTKDRPVFVNAQLSANAAALRCPGTFVVSLIATTGKIAHASNLEVTIPPVVLTRDCRLSLDPEAIMTEHSGVYDVHVTMKPAPGFTGALKLGVCASSVDNILTPSATHKYMRCQFTSNEITAAHPSSTLHVTVPLGIPDGVDYQFAVTGSVQGKVVLRQPFTITVTMDENAVVTDNMRLVEHHPPLFSKEWWVQWTGR
ncbi:hypothetical protein CCAX7_57130 [Capsulimonas corticalis]|uniref:Uncharacterized protein n=1 Tax=Capsulimonas corticalis TaxID=2219043 RepID=A0A402D0A8_9BACT|nr:hypothetical protein [Capsulimonas corticalis]BDI33662.1 hypothetical protein CCAX7_57130 [Capsulimonas corticalis]